MDVDDVSACLVKQTHPTRMRPLTEFQQTRLRRYLADRDVPCPKCEYNLRGLESDRCPECGELLSYTKARKAAADAYAKAKDHEDSTLSKGEAFGILFDPVGSAIVAIALIAIAALIAAIWWIVSSIRQLLLRGRSRQK